MKLIQIKNAYAKEEALGIGNHFFSKNSNILPTPSYSPHTATIPISFQKPGLTGKLSGSKGGGTHFKAKSRTALQKEKCGEVCYHLFPPVYHSISAVSHLRSSSPISHLCA